MRYIIFTLLIVLIWGCANKEVKQESISSVIENVPFIEGKDNYLKSPMVTAGDRLYLVGHQDGSFQELGWHIKGEMGGIWNHPIKLMDGFDIVIKNENLDSIVLNEAQKFTNYPFANKHTFTWNDLEINRWQFVPDGKEGILIQLEIINKGVSEAIEIEFTGHTDLRPTWLGERTNMIDTKDEPSWNEEQLVWTVKDSVNNWYTIFGSNAEVNNTSNKPFPYQGLGTSNAITNKVLLSEGVTYINYTIAGSYTSENEAMGTYQDIQNKWPEYLQQKKERYQALANKTKLTTPNESINQAFEWVKYNCDWLVRSVPEIGTGIGAGIPDYPWWFGVDSEYALQGYMAVGQREPVYSTIALLDSVSNAVNGNGKIIHEMSTNGTVFNPGNINETPQFVSLIWNIYEWNGDKEFLQKYYPMLKKGMKWLLKEKDTDGNLFPDGFGMMEIHGLDSEMIDVAAYTQKALEDLSKIARELDDSGSVSWYSKKAAVLKENINTKFWSDSFNSYADFIGTDEQALHLIEDAIVRADTLGKPWAVEELKQTREFILANPSKEPRPFVMHHNWVVNTPMEMNIAPKDKALKALETAEQFVNPFGVFVTGIDRDESAGSDDGSFQGSKIFSYTGAVMTLPTGVQIISENNYGRPNKALNYLERMTRSFSYALPGSIYEVSPDYGMMTQAWNIYSYAVPIVEQFFGIQPNAAEKKIVIEPQMPDDWNEASLENVWIGDNEVSINFSKSEGKTIVEISQTQDDWEIYLRLPKTELSSLQLENASEEQIEEITYHQTKITNKKAKVTLSYE